MLGSNPAADRLRKARAALVLDEPFFGSLVLRLVPVEDSSCDTMWVDGKRLGFNPAFVLGLPFPELVGVLVHEVLHCACSHHVRRGSRDPQRWNIAGDYAINPLVAGKFKLPDGVLISDEFAGLHAEAIYNRLEDESGGVDGEGPEDEGPAGDESGGEGGGGSESEDDQESGPDDGGGDESAGEDDGEGSESGADDGAESGEDDGQGGGEKMGGTYSDKGGEGEGSGSGDGRGDGEGSESGPGDPGGCGGVRDLPADDGGPASESERAESEADWRVAVSQAAAQAQARGKLPAGFDRFVDEIVNPAVDWRSVLWRFVQTAAKSDYSWLRPDRRFVHAGIYLPSCSNLELGPVVCGFDTSGSIPAAGVNAAAAEVSAICQDLRAEVWAVYCDAAVKGVDHFRPEDLPFEFKPGGGGGTDFGPVFDWVESEGLRPSCLIYFTDLDGDFPEAAPDYPVLWVVFGRSRSSWRWALRDSVPFGEVVEVQDF